MNDDDNAITDADSGSEYLRQHPAQELSLWMSWVQTVCGWKKIAPPTGREWDALTATWYHGKTPAESADELVAMRRGQPSVQVSGDQRPAQEQR